MQENVYGLSLAGKTNQLFLFLSNLTLTSRLTNSLWADHDRFYHFCGSIYGLWSWICRVVHLWWTLLQGGSLYTEPKAKTMFDLWMEIAIHHLLSVKAVDGDNSNHSHICNDGIQTSLKVLHQWHLTFTHLLLVFESVHYSSAPPKSSIFIQGSEEYLLHLLSRCCGTQHLPC